MKQYEFNDCGVCINADEVFLLCENPQYPYRGNYAIAEIAQLPDGTYKAGYNYWFIEGGGASGASNKYGDVYQTREQAIEAVGEYFIRALERMMLRPISHGEDGRTINVAPKIEKMIATIRGNIDNLTQPTLF